MAEPKDRSPREALADALRRYVDALAGATDVSRERTERIIGDLARRGEIRTRDIRKAARELAERSARNQRELAGLIQKEIRRQIDALGLATREDVGDLRERVESSEDDASGPSEPTTAPTASTRRRRPAATKKTDT